MNIVCVCLDRLHWGYLGCYGNTWVSTPAFNRLAAEGFVLNSAFCDTPDLASAYESLWRGSHIAERSAAAAVLRPTLVELARAAGLRTLLVTDDATVGEHPAGAAFDDKAEFEPAVDCEPAGDAASTHLGRLFTETLERAASIRQPFFLWFHAQAMNGPWDAPTEMRNDYADEDDPEPPTFTSVPRRELPADVDLDERFGISQAYAGQVTLVDTCLGGLLEQLEESGLDDDTAIVVLAPRGIALGEHGAVGPFDDRLHGELIQIPWLMRLPRGRGKLQRSHALVQSCDLYWTLAELLPTPNIAAEDASARWGRSVLPLVDGTARELRDRALIVGETESGIRTSAWYLRCRNTLSAETPVEENTVEEHAAEEHTDELYTKPDDIWETNDVASRCPEIVEQLRVVAQQTLAAMQTSASPPALEEVLAEGWE
ncbi:MAG: sulfatase-like hydrolase/transferase [Planctomycetia bacterium]|nr:sulfatase-like hydrolase/transferase [Planctomycetia bacterium]